MLMEDTVGHGDGSVGAAGGGNGGEPLPSLEKGGNAGFAGEDELPPFPLPPPPGRCPPPWPPPLPPPTPLPLLPSPPPTLPSPSTAAGFAVARSSVPASAFPAGGNRRCTRHSSTRAAIAAASDSRVNVPSTAAAMVPHFGALGVPAPVAAQRSATTPGIFAGPGATPAHTPRGSVLEKVLQRTSSERPSGSSVSHCASDG